MLQIPGFAPPEWAANVFNAGRAAALYGIPEREYHAARGAVSKSHLDKVAHSLRSYRHWLDSAIESEPIRFIETNGRDDAHFAIGSAFHALVLEPDLYREKVFVLPDIGNTDTLSGRKLRDDIILSKWTRGQSIITLQEQRIVYGMRDAIMEHRRVRQALSHGRSEVTIVWVDPETGLPCKVRLDWLNERDNIVLDLKSTRDASRAGFRRDAVNLRYKVQDAFYSRGAEAVGLDTPWFLFAACEKSPPHDYGCWQLSERGRLSGEACYMRELRLLANAITKDHWPSFNEEAEDVELPAYDTVEADSIT
jgi:exodeoxyribonuclease VIII